MSLCGSTPFTFSGPRLADPAIAQESHISSPKKPFIGDKNSKRYPEPASNLIHESRIQDCRGSLIKQDHRDSSSRLGKFVKKPFLNSGSIPLFRIGRQTRVILKNLILSTKQTFMATRWEKRNYYPYGNLLTELSSAIREIPLDVSDTRGVKKLCGSKKLHKPSHSKNRVFYSRGENLDQYHS